MMPVHRRTICRLRPTEQQVEHRKPGVGLLAQVVGMLVCLALLLPFTACKSIGPGTVKRDRMHYSTAVADSWKEQLLPNIVKPRYGDSPAFLEVASVVVGYSLEGVGKRPPRRNALQTRTSRPLCL